MMGMDITFIMIPMDTTSIQSTPKKSNQIPPLRSFSKSYVISVSWESASLFNIGGEPSDHVG